MDRDRRRSRLLDANLDCGIPLGATVAAEFAVAILVGAEGGGRVVVGTLRSVAVAEEELSVAVGAIFFSDSALRDLLKWRRAAKEDCQEDVGFGAHGDSDRTEAFGTAGAGVAAGLAELRFPSLENDHDGLPELLEVELAPGELLPPNKPADRTPGEDAGAPLRKGEGIEDFWTVLAADGAEAEKEGAEGELGAGELFAPPTPNARDELPSGPDDAAFAFVW